MSNSNRRDTIKLWDSYTKKLRYDSSAKFNEHNNKFVKGLSTGSELMLVIIISTLTTLKTDL